MHELSVVLNIVRHTEKLAKQYNVKKLGYISVEVGELSGALAQYMLTLWPQGTKGSICEGVPLQIIPIKAVAECAGCKNVYPLTENLKDDLPCCPVCGSDGFKLLQGGEVNIVELGAEE